MTMDRTVSTTPLPKPQFPSSLKNVNQSFLKLVSYYLDIRILENFPNDVSFQESFGITLSGRPGFDPWVRKILWRRAWQPTPVFLPGESPWKKEPGELQSMGLQRVGHD